MKQKIIYIFALILVSLSNASAQLPEDFYDEYIEDVPDELTTFAAGPYNSEIGYNFPTKGTYRMLAIFVNIIYDVNPGLDPHIVNGYGWNTTGEEGVNQCPPTQYFNDVYDVEDRLPRQGFFTRFMSECSFDSLVLLGDFTSIEIKESMIDKIGIKHHNFMRSVLDYINDSGGLQAMYGHNSIDDYDNATCANKNIGVLPQPNNKVDYVSFFVLNPCDDLVGVASGSGVTGCFTNTSTYKLKLSDGEYPIECWQVSGVGHRHLKYEPSLVIHEFAHSLLGPNSFHTSGGNHLGSGETATFLFSQNGYGLFCPSLRSCNAYERWRLGWQSPSNSPHTIAANGMSSEINGKFSGTRTFYLRDFVTYGDAIRIKLPYKDNTTSSDQYIWLENHQLGRNGKLDGHGYHFFPNNVCIPLGNPGIYAFYQVGKDVLTHTSADTVYPNNEKDNLRMINAEGNYNMEYAGEYDDCWGWGNNITFRYLSENPLSGANDQTEAINTTGESLSFFSDFHKGINNKIKDGVLYNQLICSGDNWDGFESGRVLDISSNPTPINAATYHANYSGNRYTKVDNQRDTRKKYLTGLSIKMNHAYNIGNTSVFKVDIRWDDYDVKQNVHWAGNIVLKEQLNLLEGKTIYLEQNLTPSQINRDPISGVYAPPTMFTCESGSNMSLAQDACLLLQDKSSLIFETGSELQIADGGSIVVETGSTLNIKSGASVSVSGTGKIVVKDGGYVCIENGANIVLADYASIVFLEEGSLRGTNPELFDASTCSDDISFSGIGSIVDGSKDVYVQNEQLSSNRFIGGRNIYVGNSVTTSKPQGNVVIKNAAHVIFEATGEVVFDKGFECEAGSTFEVAK